MARTANGACPRPLRNPTWALVNGQLFTPRSHFQDTLTLRCQVNAYSNAKAVAALPYYRHQHPLQDAPELHLREPPVEIMKAPSSIHACLLLASVDVGRHIRVTAIVACAALGVFLLLLLVATAGASSILVIRLYPHDCADLVAPNGYIYFGITQIRSQDPHDDIALTVVDGVSRKIGWFSSSRTAVGVDETLALPLLVPIVILAVPPAIAALQRNLRARLSRARRDGASQSLTGHV